MIVGSQKKILIFKTEEKSKSEIQGVVYFYSDDADQAGPRPGYYDSEKHTFNSCQVLTKHLYPTIVNWWNNMRIVKPFDKQVTPNPMMSKSWKFMQLIEFRHFIFEYNC